jgi:hypothetical protein
MSTKRATPASRSRKDFEKPILSNQVEFHELGAPVKDQYWMIKMLMRIDRRDEGSS